MSNRLPGATGRLRQLARHLALSAYGRVLRPSKKPVLRLLCCHYVFEEHRRQFESVIRYVQSFAEFIATDRVLDVLHGRIQLERNAFHLSFDDGLKCVVENALPILRDCGVPAILFVPTGAVAASDGALTEMSRGYIAPRPDTKFASWDDLGRACEAGFEVGSHTRTHIQLSLTENPRSVVEDEVFGSKEDVERHLGRACRYLSWPYGRLQDLADDSLDIVRRAGYQGCFGAFRGRVVPDVTDAYRIPRHHFEPDWPLAHVKCFVHGAWESS